MILTGEDCYFINMIRLSTLINIVRSGKVMNGKCTDLIKAVYDVHVFIGM